MKSRLHALTGTGSLICILSFWLATVISELFCDNATVAAVKQGILYGLVILIPALAATGASGFALARGKRGQTLDSKKRRMPLIALFGATVMLPLAFYLAAKAGSGEFDQRFYYAQALELLVGLLQITLLGRSLYDGLKLAGRLGPRHFAAAAERRN